MWHLHDVVGLLQLLQSLDGFFAAKGTAVAVAHLLVDGSNYSIQTGRIVLKQVSAEQLAQS